MLFKTSAPGSLMLLGEYAVLHHKQALVCAIDKRIHVSLRPRDDEKIIIKSALGHLETDLTAFAVEPPFQFVLAALYEFKNKLTQGCDITIESEFSATVGFASSAAVTVACVTAISAWLNMSLTEVDLIHTARKIVRNVQGLGSGADVAACVLGGMVVYAAQPFYAEKLSHTCPITVVYSGSKTPTAEAVNFVTKKFAMQPELFQAIMNSIHQCVVAGVDLVKKSHWSSLGEIMDVQQGLMAALGVNTTILNEIIECLQQSSSIMGAKISGSGLGDCVVALGEVDENHLAKLPAAAQVIKVAMTQRGVECEQG